MGSLHFKNFFEEYFNYPYDKLNFLAFNDSVRIQTQIANTYKCLPNDVECILLFKKISPIIRHDDGYGGFLEDRYDFKFYGFYRIRKSNFYVPFNVYLEERYALPFIEFDFNYDINNSVFDLIHFPLKKEKTSEFYYRIIKNLSVDINYVIFESGVMALDEPVKRRTVYIDLYSNQVELANHGKNFNEQIMMSFNAEPENYLYFNYDLKYYLNNQCEHLFIYSKLIDDFNKSNFLSQSFNGVDLFCDFNYKTINELDVWVKKYREIEKMYII